MSDLAEKLLEISKQNFPRNFHFDNPWQRDKLKKLLPKINTPMFIISTTTSTPQGEQIKFVQAVNENNPSYTSKRELAMNFDTEAEANSQVEILKVYIAKTFTVEAVLLT